MRLIIDLGKSYGANEVNHPHSTVTAEIKKNNIYIYYICPGVQVAEFVIYKQSWGGLLYLHGK